MEFPRSVYEENARSFRANAQHCADMISHYNTYWRPLKGSESVDKTIAHIEENRDYFLRKAEEYDAIARSMND